MKCISYYFMIEECLRNFLMKVETVKQSRSCKAMVGGRCRYMGNMFTVNCIKSFSSQYCNKRLRGQLWPTFFVLMDVTQVAQWEDAWWQQWLELHAGGQRGGGRLWLLGWGWRVMKLITMFLWHFYQMSLLHPSKESSSMGQYIVFILYGVHCWYGQISILGHWRSFLELFLPPTILQRDWGNVGTCQTAHIRYCSGLPFNGSKVLFPTKKRYSPPAMVFSLFNLHNL